MSRGHRIASRINTQLEEKGIQLMAAKYKIEQYIKEISSAQHGPVPSELPHGEDGEGYAGPAGRLLERRRVPAVGRWKRGKKKPMRNPRQKAGRTGSGDKIADDEEARRYITAHLGKMTAEDVCALFLVRLDQAAEMAETYGQGEKEHMMRAWGRSCPPCSAARTS